MDGRRRHPSGSDALPGCCICKVGFKGIGYSDSRKELVPLVLKCTHSSCDKCIFACLNMNKPITCGVCQQVSPSPSSYKEEDIRALFPVNMHLLGLWSKRTKEYFEGDSQISFPKKTAKKEIKPRMSSVMCNECTVPANCFCESCRSAYCHLCFKKVHAAAKVFKSHKSVSLVRETGVTSSKNLMCSIHHDKKLELFCTQCYVSICPACLVSEHNGHNLKSLADQNKETLHEIIASYTKATDVMNIMKVSTKKAQQAMKHSKSGSLNASHEQKIKQHFVKLHAQLEIMENDLLLKLNSSSRIASLNEVIENLSENVDRIRATLTETESAVKSEGFVDLVSLLQELRELERLPCILYTSKNNDDDENCLEIDPSIFKTLNDHITLRVNDSVSYQLTTENDAPDEALKDLPNPCSLEEIRSQLLACHPFRPSSSNAGSVYADYAVVKSGRAVSPMISQWSSSSSLSSNNSFVLDPTQLLAPPDDLVIGLTFKAFVSHITSPSDFYIQRFGVKKKLDSLQRELRRYGTYIQKMRREVVYQTGQYYMTMYTGDNNWSRCQLLDFIGIDEVRVLYIDYGNHQKVLKSTLIPLPESLALIPPFAVRCSIFNCYPRRSSQWDPKAVSVMSRIMEGTGNTFITIVRKNQLNCLTVKLYKQTETNTIDVGEALIFLEFAQCGSSESFTQDTGEIGHPKPYPAQITLKAEEVQHKIVRLTHVVSPDEFYIVMNPASVDFQNMWKSMSYSYSTLDKRINNSRTVYYPAVGIAVAVTNGERFLGRGLVVEMLPNKIVKVFLVDEGPTCMVEWDKLRTLELKYFTLPPQAYRCAMAGVQPEDGAKWPEGAAALIESYKGETLRIAPQVSNNNHTSVLLIQSGSEIDICVNALLVRKGMARSVGPYGDIVEYPKLPVLATPKEPYVSNRTKDISQRSAHRQPVKQGKKQKKRDDENDDLVVKTEDGLKVKITVVRVVNPGEFHVSVERTIKCFERLNIELNEFYENFHGEERIWQLNDRCAVKTDGSWKRAVVIKEPDRKTHVEVHLVDEDTFMSVPTAPDRLAVLDPQFANLPQKVLECTLGGIVPAGSSSWTLSSISEMNEFLDTHKNNLYITPMRKRPEDESRHVLPVLLLGRHTTEPLATEPEYVSWHSLNHLLRWKGLAKADEFTKWDHKGNIIEESNNPMEEESTFIAHLLTSEFSLTSEGKVDLCRPSSNCLGTFKLKWPPALPLKSLNFVAKTTFVGSNCDVWIQDPMAVTDTLNMISAEATKMCEETNPPDPSTWEAGDICLGKYFLDNTWYRAEIVELNANANHHLVRFVDYGNEEYLEPHELRYANGTTLRPIQAHVCYFDNLSPIGDVWLPSHINEIHTLLVDVHVCVNLRVLSNNLLGIQKMILPDGRNALMEIVSRRLGVYHRASSEKFEPATSEIRSDSKEANLATGDSQQNTSVDENDVGSGEEGSASDASQVNINNTEDSHELPKKGYQPLTIPTNVEEMQVEITSILSPELCTIQISKTDDAELISITESYKELVNTMQLEAESQPTLEPPYLSKDCCCKFEEDNKWYRAVVIHDSSDHDGNLVIQFVDYGNVQKSPVDRVKQMKDSWFSVPMQSIPCRIDGYSFRPDIPEMEAMVCLQDVLIDQPFVKAVIKKRENDLLVDFYNEEGQLSYLPLIDSKQLLPSSSA